MRRHLVSIRVVQKNLVYVIGLPHRVGVDESLLRRHEYFGKYGKIVKVVINRNNHYNSGPNPTVSAYVTFARKEDASKCVRAVDKSTLDGKVLRASFGTTKYCSNYLKNQPCQNPDCMYLHELGDEASSYTKQDMLEGKHNADVSIVEGHHHQGHMHPQDHGAHEMHPDAIGATRPESGHDVGFDDALPEPEVLRTSSLPAGVGGGSSGSWGSALGGGDRTASTSGGGLHSGTLGQHLAAVGAAPLVVPPPLDLTQPGYQTSGFPSAAASDLPPPALTSAGLDPLPFDWAPPPTQVPPLQRESQDPLMSGNDFFARLHAHSTANAPLSGHSHSVPPGAGVTPPIGSLTSPFGGGVGRLDGGDTALDGWGDLSTGLVGGGLGLGSLAAPLPAAELPPLPGLPTVTPGHVAQQAPPAAGWDLAGLRNAPPPHPTTTAAQTSSRFAFARQPEVSAHETEHERKDQWQEQMRSLFPGVSIRFTPATLDGTFSQDAAPPSKDLPSSTSPPTQPHPPLLGNLSDPVGPPGVHVRHKRGRGRGFAGSYRGRGAIGRGGGRKLPDPESMPTLAARLGENGILPGGPPLTTTSSHDPAGAKHLESLFSGLALQQQQHSAGQSNQVGRGQPRDEHADGDGWVTTGSRKMATD